MDTNIKRFKDIWLLAVCFITVLVAGENSRKSISKYSADRKWMCPTESRISCSSTNAYMSCTAHKDCAENEMCCLMKCSYICSIPVPTLEVNKHDNEELNALLQELLSIGEKPTTTTHQSISPTRKRGEQLTHRGRKLRYRKRPRWRSKPRTPNLNAKHQWTQKKNLTTFITTSHRSSEILSRNVTAGSKTVVTAEPIKPEIRDTLRKEAQSTSLPVPFDVENRNNKNIDVMSLGLNSIDHQDADEFADEEKLYKELQDLSLKKTLTSLPQDKKLITTKKNTVPPTRKRKRKLRFRKRQRLRPKSWRPRQNTKYPSTYKETDIDAIPMHLTSSKMYVINVTAGPININTTKSLKDTLRDMQSSGLSDFFTTKNLNNKSIGIVHSGFNSMYQKDANEIDDGKILYKKLQEMSLKEILISPSQEGTSTETKKSAEAPVKKRKKLRFRKKFRPQFKKYNFPKYAHKKNLFMRTIYVSTTEAMRITPPRVSIIDVERVINFVGNKIARNKTMGPAVADLKTTGFQTPRSKLVQPGIFLFNSGAHSTFANEHHPKNYPTIISYSIERTDQSRDRMNVVPAKNYNNGIVQISPLGFHPLDMQDINKFSDKKELYKELQDVAFMQNTTTFRPQKKSETQRSTVLPPPKKRRKKKFRLRYKKKQSLTSKTHEKTPTMKVGYPSVTATFKADLSATNPMLLSSGELVTKNATVESSNVNTAELISLPPAEFRHNIQRVSQTADFYRTVDTNLTKTYEKVIHATNVTSQSNDQIGIVTAGNRKFRIARISPSGFYSLDARVIDELTEEEKFYKKLMELLLKKMPTSSPQKETTATRNKNAKQRKRKLRYRKKFRQRLKKKRLKGKARKMMPFYKAEPEQKFSDVEIFNDKSQTPTIKSRFQPITEAAEVNAENVAIDSVKIIEGGSETNRSMTNFYLDVTTNSSTKVEAVKSNTNFYKNASTEADKIRYKKTEYGLKVSSKITASSLLKPKTVPKKKSLVFKVPTTLRKMKTVLLHKRKPGQLYKKKLIQLRKKKPSPSHKKKLVSAHIKKPEPPHKKKSASTHKKKPSSIHKKKLAPSRKKSASTRKKQTSTYKKKSASAHKKKPASIHKKKLAPSRKTASTHKKPASTYKKKSASTHKKKSPSIHKKKPAPSHKKSASPHKKPAPSRKKSASPHKKPVPSRKKSASTYKKKSIVASKRKPVAKLKKISALSRKKGQIFKKKTSRSKKKMAPPRRKHALPPKKTRATPPKKKSAAASKRKSLVKPRKKLSPPLKKAALFYKKKLMYPRKNSTQPLKKSSLLPKKSASTSKRKPPILAKEKSILTPKRKFARKYRKKPTSPVKKKSLLPKKKMSVPRKKQVSLHKLKPASQSKKPSRSALKKKPVSPPKKSALASNRNQSASARKKQALKSNRSTKRSHWLVRRRWNHTKIQPHRLRKTSKTV